MGIYRKQIEIVGDILYAAEELTIDHNGASITNLIQKANISHSRISKILTNLVSQGLLEQVDSKRACKYKISMTGKDFLKEYRTFSEFTDNFGLTISVSIFQILHHHPSYQILFFLMVILRLV